MFKKLAALAAGVVLLMPGVNWADQLKSKTGAVSVPHSPKPNSHPHTPKRPSGSQQTNSNRVG
jgi:hypothetical protein